MTPSTENLAVRAAPEALPAEAPAFPEMGARRFGPVNWLGVWTLYCKEVRRFTKVPAQTIFAPVVTALLFLFIFSFAFGSTRPSVGNAPFVDFLVPGLVMMSLIQNAFANSSSSLLISKVMGNVVDILMPPLSPGEMATAFITGATTRGMAVGICVLLAVVMVRPLPFSHAWALLYFSIGGALLLGQMGLLAGIWSEKFDHLQAVTNFVIMPLSFLSGTFYPISALPEVGQWVSLFNPFFYLIDGFRYGYIGIAESNLAVGVGLVAALNLLMWCACYYALRSGWRLKT